MNNRILLRIAATEDIDIEENTDDEADDLQFDFDSIFNTDDTPKSDIEKMVTQPISTDIDSFDPYFESEEQANKRVNEQMVAQVFNNLSIEARGVLKRIEDFKFKIIQARNILKADQDLKIKIEQKQKILDSAAAQIYGIAFDLENYNLTPNYENEQLAGESFPTMEVPEDDFGLENEESEENVEDMEAEEESINEEGNNEEPADLMQGGFEDMDMPEASEGESEEV